MRVAVTGSTGLVGGALMGAFEAAGHEALPIERRDQGGLFWTREGQARLVDDEGRGPDAVVHLAGAPIAAKRWTDDYKREIRESRVEGTRALVRALGALPTPPRVLVSASAVAVYGPDCGDAAQAEERVPEAALTAPHDDYLTDVARGWEREAFAARALGIGRVATLRIGIVLDKDGGALEKMMPPFRFGLGGKLGSGDQWMSWITLGDLVALVRTAVEDERYDGPFNAVAPGAVTNLDFTRALARALGRPLLPGMFVPRFALRLMVGEFAEAALLVSHRVAPTGPERLGFEFGARELDGGLAVALGT